MTHRMHLPRPAASVRALTGLTAALLLIACERAPGTDSAIPAAAERIERAPLQKQPPVAAPAIAAAVQPLTPAPIAKPAVDVSPSTELVVKRFVVATGVENREPLVGSTIESDAARVFAFAELANPSVEPRRVRVTFERKGSTERVGHAVLEVPAGSKRYRTWGTSRHVKEPGEWEAVLWTESNVELGRAPFVVAQATPIAGG